MKMEREIVFFSPALFLLDFLRKPGGSLYKIWQFNSVNELLEGSTGWLVVVVEPSISIAREMHTWANWVKCFRVWTEVFANANEQKMYVDELVCQKSNA